MGQQELPWRPATPGNGSHVVVTPLLALDRTPLCVRLFTVQSPSTNTEEGHADEDVVAEGGHCVHCYRCSAVCWCCSKCTNTLSLPSIIVRAKTEPGIPGGCPCRYLQAEEGGVSKGVLRPSQCMRIAAWSFLVVPWSLWQPSSCGRSLTVAGYRAEPMLWTSRT